MEDKICSPGRYWMKNLYGKKRYSNDKKPYNKNISQWIQTCFD